MLKIFREKLCFTLFSMSVCVFALTSAQQAFAVSTFQAESYSSQSGCTLDTTTGYTGTGDMKYGGNGSYVQWDTVKVPAAGKYTLFYRYSNASGLSKPCATYVNSVDKGTLNFPANSLWANWQYCIITVDLNAGTNIVKLMANTATGGPRLDKMELEYGHQAEAYSSQSGCTNDTTTLGFSGIASIAYSGNGSYLQWDTVNAATAGTYTLYFRYSNTSGVNQPCTLYVGGVSVGTLNFAFSTAANSWQICSMNVTLAAGNNIIKLMANSAAGGPKLDNMDVESGMYTRAWWETRFNAYWTNEYNEYYTDSLTADSWPYYFIGYAIDANTAMYRGSTASDKNKYIDRALLYVNNMISCAVVSSSIPTSQYRDSYMAWPEWTNPDVVDHGKEYPLYESCCWRYVAKLLYVIKNDPALYSAYQTDYNNILAFTEQNIFQKWYNRGTGNIYRVNTHMTSHWATIALYLYNLSTDNTWKPVYQTVYQNIHSNGVPNYAAPYNNLRNMMITNPNDASAYFWNWNWGSTATPGSDVSHGGHTVTSIVEANEMNYTWTDVDMLKFNNLLLNIIWDDTSYPLYVDGTGTGLQTALYDGWIKLGRHDPRILKKMQALSTSLDTQLFGNGALNARKLGM